MVMVDIYIFNIITFLLKKKLFIKAGPEAFVVLENVNYTNNET